MKNLNVETLAGKNLMELSNFEMELDAYKLEAYSSIGEQMETVSVEEVEELKTREQILDKMFEKLESVLERAIELASLREMAI